MWRVRRVVFTRAKANAAIASQADRQVPPAAQEMPLSGG